MNNDSGKELVSATQMVDNVSKQAKQLKQIVKQAEQGHWSVNKELTTDLDLNHPIKEELITDYDLDHPFKTQLTTDFEFDHPIKHKLTTSYEFDHPIKKEGTTDIQLNQPFTLENVTDHQILQTIQQECPSALDLSRTGPHYQPGTEETQDEIKQTRLPDQHDNTQIPKRQIRNQLSRPSNKPRNVVETEKIIPKISSINVQCDEEIQAKCTEEQTSFLLCNTCSEEKDKKVIFSTGLSLAVHVKLAHHKTPETTGPNFQFTCYGQGVKYHCFPVVQEVVMECKYGNCIERFTNDLVLQNHIAECHSDGPENYELTCQYKLCNRKFTSQELRRQHVLDFHIEHNIEIQDNYGALWVIKSLPFSSAPMNTKGNGMQQGALRELQNFFRHTYHYKEISFIPFDDFVNSVNQNKLIKSKASPVVDPNAVILQRFEKLCSVYHVFAEIKNSDIEFLIDLNNAKNRMLHGGFTIHNCDIDCVYFIDDVHGDKESEMTKPPAITNLKPKDVEMDIGDLVFLYGKPDPNYMSDVKEKDRFDYQSADGDEDDSYVICEDLDNTVEKDKESVSEQDVNIKTEEMFDNDNTGSHRHKPLDKNSSHSRKDTINKADLGVRKMKPAFKQKILSNELASKTSTKVTKPFNNNKGSDKDHSKRLTKLSPDKNVNGTNLNVTVDCETGVISGKINKPMKSHKKSVGVHTWSVKEIGHCIATHKSQTDTAQMETKCRLKQKDSSLSDTLESGFASLNKESESMKCRESGSTSLNKDSESMKCFDTITNSAINDKIIISGEVKHRGFKKQKIPGEGIENTLESHNVTQNLVKAETQDLSIHNLNIEQVIDDQSTEPSQTIQGVKNIIKARDHLPDKESYDNSIENIGKSHDTKMAGVTKNGKPYDDLGNKSATLNNKSLHNMRKKIDCIEIKSSPYDIKEANIPFTEIQRKFKSSENDHSVNEFPVQKPGIGENVKIYRRSMEKNVDRQKTKQFKRVVNKHNLSNDIVNDIDLKTTNSSNQKQNEEGPKSLCKYVKHVIEGVEVKECKIDIFKLSCDDINYICREFKLGHKTMYANYLYSMQPEDARDYDQLINGDTKLNMKPRKFKRILEISQNLFKMRKLFLENPDKFTGYNRKRNSESPRKGKLKKKKRDNDEVDFDWLMDSAESSSLSEDSEVEDLNFGDSDDDLLCPEPDCGRSFHNSVQLERHLSRDHGEDVYTERKFCPIDDCNKSYSGKNNLMVHIKKDHGIEAFNAIKTELNGVKPEETVVVRPAGTCLMPTVWRNPQPLIPPHVKANSSQNVVPRNVREVEDIKNILSDFTQNGKGSFYSILSNK